MAAPRNPYRPPSGAEGREYLTPAHRATKVRAAERYIDKILSTWPPLRDEDRRHLADLLAP